MNSTSLAQLEVEEIARRLQQNMPHRVADEAPPTPGVKCAAVLVPFLKEGGEWHLLFTRRTDKVESHKGQVSFPGGACDVGERTAEETALREAEEEIGLPAHKVRLIGRLPSMVTISQFRVTPVVGILDWPLALKISTIEVARVFTIPLVWLADPHNRWEFHHPERGTVIVYHPFDGELLWGATARMTLMLVEMLLKN